ncbi:plasmid segregation protein ParM domain-containing protein [Vibrio panuliri]|uniref:Plasmid segregation protein ParM/StbA domain-containing protein n=1 Tax=Vibrio panuliri TaxID=1381081 RepID=A0ABX3FG82_9VIBR|nr:plasmid segregation protein ParM domain-containing protein [Vibrio panuliri]KAB1460860.1 hypothetical protein F7O85_00350 [Vibrio panuliri]OLQ91666.1 hypothetical protein BIY20_09695 [Vibrio panuliri]
MTTKTPTKVVVDDGSTQAKVVHKHGGKWKGCTCITRVVHGALNKGVEVHPAAYLVGSTSYTVHASAANPMPNQSLHYQVSEYNAVAVHNALIEAGLGGVKVDLVVTLPTADFYGANGDVLVEKKKENLKSKVSNLAGRPTAIISNVSVYPEAVPIVAEVIFSPDGEYEEDFEEDSRFLVIDIGGTTTDMAVVTGSLDVENYKSVRHGVLGLMTEAEQNLMRAKGLSTIGDAYMQKAVKQGSDDQDTLDAIEAARVTLLQHIVSNTEQLAPEWRTFDRVIVAGGGSIVLKDKLHDYFGEKFETPSEPVGALAIGAYKLEMMDE